MNHDFSNHFGIAVDFCQKETVSSNNTAFQHDVTFPIWDNFHMYASKEKKTQIIWPSDQIPPVEIEGLNLF